MADDRWVGRASFQICRPHLIDGLPLLRPDE